MSDEQLDKVIDQLILHWHDDPPVGGATPPLRLLAQRVARTLPAGVAVQVEAAPEANRQVIALALNRLEQRDPATREILRSLAPAGAGGAQAVGGDKSRRDMAVTPPATPPAGGSAGAASPGYPAVPRPATTAVFHQSSGVQVAGDYLSGNAVKASGDYVAGDSFKPGGDYVAGNKSGGNYIGGNSFGDGNVVSFGGNALGRDRASGGVAPNPAPAAPAGAPYTAAGSPATAITILFVGANPLDGARLRLDEEVRGIDAALRRGTLRDRFELKQVWAVRMLDLQAALLQHQPQILHFSGHGSSANAIYLEDDSGHSLPVGGPLLARLLSPFSRQLRCVVLNACYSEGQAKAIAQHVECVIGMAIAVGDDAALHFAAAFYQALAYGADVQTAFDLGCVHVQPTAPGEENTPRLIALRRQPSEVVLTAPPKEPATARASQ